MKQLSWLVVFLLAVTVINYPNPFNPKGGEVTTIECTTDASQETNLYLYDLSARQVWRSSFSLVGGTTTRLNWNGYSNANELVGTGVYLYQIVNQAKHRVAKGKIWVVNK
jgi:hypothetical protein